jgi:hypothetical protein
MNEVLGLIDSVEATILEGKKVPFSDKVVLDERKLLILIDKLRLVIKNDPSMIRRSIETSGMVSDSVIAAQTPVVIETPVGIHPDVLRQAEEESQRVRRSADEYADNVLAHLQMVVTRAQKTLIKLEQSIDSGRDHLGSSRNERAE